MSSGAAPFERFLAGAAVDSFDTDALLRRMLAFEAALAQAEAAEGLVPAQAATVIAAVCDETTLDGERIAADSTAAGSLAIPFVKALTAAVAARDPAAAAWVHWGSTSQDVLDSALVLATRDALARLDATLARVVGALAAHARHHADTPVLARTLLQPAQVVSVGYKLIAWIAPLVRARERLARAAHEGLQLQFGGAAGTLASLGAHGDAVARRLGEALGLRVVAGAWHTQRDDWVALGAELGVLCGSLGKIGLDLGLLAQAELGEITEPAGAAGQRRGGSSAMPHKRNPVAAMQLRAAALRAPQRVAALLAAMAQEHERALGGWQAELAEWSQLVVITEGALQALADVADGLVIAPARMRANIEALNGLVFAEAASTLFAGVLGKPAAHALLDTLAQRCVADKVALRELAQQARTADPRLSASIDAAALDEAFDIDRAARHAGAIARARLAALAAPRVPG